MYFRINVIIMKDAMLLLTNEIKYAPHSACEMELKGGSGEAFRTVGTEITLRKIAILNVTQEKSKVSLDIVIPSDVILVTDGLADLDGVTIFEVIVQHRVRTITKMM